MNQVWLGQLGKHMGLIQTWWAGKKVNSCLLLRLRVDLEFFGNEHPWPANFPEAEAFDFIGASMVIFIISADFVCFIPGTFTKRNGEYYS